MRALPQRIQEIHYFSRGRRHFGGERHFGIALIANQMRGFLTQRENLSNQGRVVPLRLAEFGSARHIRAVQLFAQGAMLGVLHHRHIGWPMQREFPARLAIGGGRFLRRLQHICGKTGDFDWVLDILCIVVGGVEQVFLEARGERGQLFLNRLKAFFLIFRQLSAAKPEIAQLVIDDFFCAEVSCANSSEALIALNLSKSFKFCDNSA